jgi:hypothetical protein
MHGAMKSTLKTTAAVLRSITGERDSDWAKLLGKSVHTIRHLEAGTLKLSAALAAKMNYETGISIKWLMDGDENAPPVSAGGQEYTKAIYDVARARQKYFATLKKDEMQSTCLDFLCAYYRRLVSANRKRKGHLYVYRSAKFLGEIRDEFGEAKDISDSEVLDCLELRWNPPPIPPPPKHVPELIDLSPSSDKQPTSKPKSKRPSTKRRKKEGK